MTMEPVRTIDEAAIRRLVEHQAKAIRAKDVDGVLSCYAPDVVQFDLAPPLVIAGAAAHDRTLLEGWFSTFTGAVGYELGETAIAVDGDLAYCHGLARISGSRTDGEETDVWVRATMCFRRIGGTWKVTHEHRSVPFYMDGSLKAAVDLHP